MLFACGGGGDDDSGISDTSDAVSAANRTVPENVLTATLTPSQDEQKISSTGTGIGVVMIDPASRVMRATLTTAGLNGLSVHIQLTSSGADGPILFALTELPAGSGIWSAQMTLTEEQFALLRAGNYFFNVRSAAFPEGEISGQILRQLPQSGTTDSNGGTGGDIDIIDSGNFIDGGTIATNTGSAGRLSTGINSAGLFPGTINRRTTFVNMLTAQQVPASGSNATAIGVAIVDPVDGIMVTSITSIGISGQSAHIHQAPAGSNGDMIFTLNETALGSGIWAARLQISNTQLNAFADGNYYFDIHTAAFPNGAVRGQIVASSATGNFVTGSGGNTTGGTGTGVASGGVTNTPFAPGSITGTGNRGTPSAGSASVPSFGNPAGSGIGGAGTTSFIGTSVPTFGNPVGSGIGSEPSISVTGSPVPSTAGFGASMDSASSTGSSGSLTISTAEAFGTNGLSTSRF